MPVGKVAYTEFLNEIGGVEADLTVTRLAENRFLVVTAAFTTTHVIAWIRENVPDDAVCVITEVSGAYAMLNLQGPNSRALLSQISSADFSTEAFPFGTMQPIEIGYQTAMAVRISYASEFSWELYIPTEMALPVYDLLIEAGVEHGLRHCGYHTLNTLRIEKAYREWAHDMGPRDMLLEAGLEFTCAWDKPGGFIGREALDKQRQSNPLKRRLMQVLLDDPIADADVRCQERAHELVAAQASPNVWRFGCASVVETLTAAFTTGTSFSPIGCIYCLRASAAST